MSTLAQELRGMTKRMIIGLNEIHPAVSAKGMEMESGVIGQMKDDVEALDVILTRMDGSESQRDRTIVEVAALRGIMISTVEPAEMSDEELQVALMAAESFVRRGYDYLLSKQSFLEGEQHG